MTKIDPIQRIVADSYCGGDFSHVKTMEEVKYCGDGLFAFLMSELSMSEDCGNINTAMGRILIIRQQLLRVEDALGEFI